MCDLITHPTHSIIKQSYASLERIDNSPLNGDGFGIGWYTSSPPPESLTHSSLNISDPQESHELHQQHPRREPRTPCVFLSVTPAWNNLNLIRLAEKIKSPLFFGHVRAASPGILTSETNCHPFLYGQFMWMHNGVIAEFKAIKRKLMGLLSDNLYLHIQGTTDSEAIFMFFLNNLQRKYPNTDLHTAEVDPFVLKEVMEETVQTLVSWHNEMNLTSPSHMNFFISDGNSVIATRYTHPRTAAAVSLYFASGTEFAVGKDNDYEMLQTDRRQLCHIIASEPLSKKTTDWIPVPRDHLLVVTKDSSLLMFPMRKEEEPLSV